MNKKSQLETINSLYNFIYEHDLEDIVMTGIRIDGDFTRLKSTIKNLENLKGKKIQINRVIGQELRTSTVQRFKDEEDPQGKKWKKSIRAINEGGQTLTHNADLKNSIRVKATSEGVAVGTNKIYAGTHQLGGKFTIRAKNKEYLRFKIKDRWITKKEVEVDMPKREFLGISKEDIEEIKAILEDEINSSIE